MGRPDFSPRGGGGCKETKIYDSEEVEVATVVADDSAVDVEDSAAIAEVAVDSVALPVDCGGRGSPIGGRGGRGGARGEMRGGKSVVVEPHRYEGDGVHIRRLLLLDGPHCGLLHLLRAFCIFFAIYTVICIDELKTDYKNPIEQCRSLHILVLPEYILHGIATVCNVPLVIFHAYTYSKRPVMSGPGIYDPTTILNRTELTRCTRSWVKLAFYLISFFYYLYGLIYTLVTN